MKKKLTALMLAAASAISVFASFQAFAADKYDNEENHKALAAYRQELITGNWIRKANPDTQYPSECADPNHYAVKNMCLVDINDDGIYELFAEGFCDEHFEGTEAYYTYKNGLVSSLDQGSKIEMLTCFDPSSGIFQKEPSRSMAYEAVYRLNSDGTTDYLYNYYLFAENEPGDFYYDICKEHCSEFHSFRDHSRNAVFVEITPENIEKYLSGNGTPTAASDAE